MPREVRFGIRVGDHFSQYWKVRTAPTKPQFVVTSQRTGGFMHVTVHEPEYGFHVKVKAPQGLVVHKLPHPTPFAPGATRLVQLRVPFTAATHEDPGAKGVVWIETPPDPERWVAFEIIVIDPDVLAAEEAPAWLGDLPLIGVIERSDGSGVAVVAWLMKGEGGSWTGPIDEATRQRIKDALADGTELRTLLQGVNPDGSFWFLELVTEAGATPSGEGETA